jgi:non-specific serine/threonine protein kinase/serine/threonine-protein kinase
LIHRDLKPSNVLVSTLDDRPVVKVIDFGIAKATQARLTEKTLFTEFKQLIGTPEYMSPEQAGADLDIDTRSDVYSLGVLMYELLTGSPPFDAKELRSKAYAEMQRIIREVDPPSPSARLSTLDVLPTVAAHRQLEPRRLCQTVQGELDWIVMKCLEKDRARRYESAAAVAADIAHHLADEPVSVGAPSRAYRIRKFVRRNKAPVAAAAVILAALVIGIIGTTIGLISESRRRVIAERERATAQFNLGMAFQSNHRLAEAEELYRISVQTSSGSAVLDDRQQTARALLNLAYNLWTQHRMVEAERAYLEALTAVRQAYPPGDPYTAHALRAVGQHYRNAYNNWERAEPYFREALEISRKLSPPDHAALAADTFDEGDALSNTGRFAEAVPLMRESVAESILIADREGRGYAAWQLGLALVAQGKMQEAEAAFLEARESLGNDKQGWSESATLAILYLIWDQVEPGKGYDAKAKQWHDRLINDSAHFRAALAILTRPATRPSTTRSSSE